MPPNDKRPFQEVYGQGFEQAKPLVLSDVVLSSRELLLELASQFLDFQEDNAARSRLLSRIAIVKQTEADNKWARAIARDRLKATAQQMLDLEEDKNG